MEALIRSVRDRRIRRGNARSPSRVDAEFLTSPYIRHDQRRQEHLASLALPVIGRSVLEVGAGVGNHSSFFIDRGCQLTITDGRPENVAAIRRRYPDVPARVLDLDDPDPDFEVSAEIVYCYGLLYHLRRPAEAIAFLRDHCRGMLLLETCVTPGDADELYPVSELAEDVTQAISGQGCRPTRRWVYNRLAAHFPYVYVTKTQPWHDEFPLDWRQPSNGAPYSRAVFVAALAPVQSEYLTRDIPLTQVRHP